jgi:hypothetical protein
MPLKRKTITVTRSPGDLQSLVDWATAHGVSLQEVKYVSHVEAEYTDPDYGWPACIREGVEAHFTLTRPETDKELAARQAEHARYLRRRVEQDKAELARIAKEEGDG